MDPILKIDNVSKQYSGHLALDEVSLDVPRGGVYGLLGPNGAGKTTLIRIINHITAPDTGTVTFDGHTLTADDVASIGYLPEERGLYKKMKVGEQALFFARLKGLGKQEATRQLKEWFDRLEISDWWNRKVEELSKGMAQKVQFVVTVLHRPKLLIFDEPFSGFDPINASLLQQQILRLRDEGATILFSTHNMASVEELCDNITLINRGRNVLTGNVDELRRSHSNGRYAMTFATPADLSVIKNAVAPMVVESDFAESSKGNTRMTVKLVPGASATDLISAANPIVAISDFNPVLATMSDIFINTVNTTSDEI